MPSFSDITQRDWLPAGEIVLIDSGADSIAKFGMILLIRFQMPLQILER